MLTNSSQMRFTCITGESVTFGSASRLSTERRFALKFPMQIAVVTPFCSKGMLEIYQITLPSAMNYCIHWMQP